jgi:lipopolysaccharide transport system permease protein
MNLSVRQYVSLIHTQAIMKLKAQGNTLVLSYLWWILEPLLYVLMFYLVFKFILYRGGDDFFIFLMVGKIPFLWFSKGITSGANSIRENQGLIALRKIPKVIFPIINAQETLYKQVFVFAVLLVAASLSGYDNFSEWWQLIPLVLLQWLLIISVGTLLSVFVTWAPDFMMIVNMGIMFLLFTSGIFWEVNMIQDLWVRDMLLKLNPVAALIHGYRQVLIYPETLSLDLLLPIAYWILFSYGLSYALISKLDNYLTRKLYE